MIVLLVVFVAEVLLQPLDSIQYNALMNIFDNLGEYMCKNWNEFFHFQLSPQDAMERFVHDSIPHQIVLGQV